MIGVDLAKEADFEGWRAAARTLAERAIAPEKVVWRTPASPGDLFDLRPLSEAATEPATAAGVRVSQDFVETARLVVCHGDDDRYGFLYRLLLRLVADPSLKANAIDDDMRRLHDMARSVRRDRHKMTAFVRFREVEMEDGKAYIAWFEPEHHIVELAAPFFVARFAAMRWSILTPRASAHWDGAALRIAEGATRAQAPNEDALEDVWRTYYASIFNPARVKVDAMRREMPKKYWVNLPEARLVSDLVRDAGARETEMIETPAAKAPARAETILRCRREDVETPAPPPGGLATLREEAAGCRRCPLYKDATQTVFGEGLPQARLVFVGEQPGDSEDLAGKPFVGPAGQLFDKALEQAGIARADAYVTNAVKHFKYEPRGKRRIHKKPSTGEIDACRWWVDQELGVIKPHLAVALGATAARGLTGKTTPVMAARGTVVPGLAVDKVFVTVHPSFLLRLPDEDSKRREWAAFVRDLKHVRELMEAA